MQDDYGRSCVNGAGPVGWRRRDFGDSMTGRRLDGFRRTVSAVALIVTLAMVTATTARAASGNTSAAPGTAAGTVVAPIVLTHTAGAALGFGSFTVGSGGTIVVTAAGAGSTTSSVAFVPGGAGVTADKFALTGDVSRNFTISTTNGTVTSGSRSMAFTTVPSATTGTTSASGGYNFSVGGTLTATGTETPGIYTGTYSATVTYN